MYQVWSHTCCMQHVVLDDVSSGSTAMDLPERWIRTISIDAIETLTYDTAIYNTRYINVELSGCNLVTAPPDTLLHTIDLNKRHT